MFGVLHEFSVCTGQLKLSDKFGNDKFPHWLHFQMEETQCNHSFLTSRKWIKASFEMFSQPRSHGSLTLHGTGTGTETGTGTIDNNVSCRCPSPPCVVCAVNAWYRNSPFQFPVECSVYKPLVGIGTSTPKQNFKLSSSTDVKKSKPSYFGNIQTMNSYPFPIWLTV